MSNEVYFFEGLNFFLSVLLLGALTLLLSLITLVCGDDPLELFLRSPMSVGEVEGDIISGDFLSTNGELVLSFDASRISDDEICSAFERFETSLLLIDFLDKVDTFFGTSCCEVVSFSEWM